MNRNAAKSALAWELFKVDIPPGLFERQRVLEKKLLVLEQYDALQEELRKPERIREIPPVAGAIENLRRLAKDGHFIAIISANEGRDEIAIHVWLKYHNVQVPAYGVGYGVSKAARAQILELDTFVDDSLEKLKGLARIKRRLLLSWPYNESDDVTGIATRIGSLSEVYPG